MNIEPRPPMKGDRIIHLHVPHEFAPYTFRRKCTGQTHAKFDNLWLLYGALLRRPFTLSLLAFSYLLPVLVYAPGIYFLVLPPSPTTSRPLPLLAILQSFILNQQIHLPPQAPHYYHPSILLPQSLSRLSAAKVGDNDNDKVIRVTGCGKFSSTSTPPTKAHI